MKTKTAAAGALALLAIPVSAQATDGDHERGKSAEHRKAHAEHHKSKAHHQHKGRGFAIKGSTAQTAVPVTDGKLTGPLTLDPKSANRHARRLLDLTKPEIRGTDTASFGETGDEVKVVYKGLSSTDTLQPTDVVRVHGKVKQGTLDIRSIVVKRAT